MQSLPVMVVGTCICGFSNGIGVTTTLIGLGKSRYCQPQYHERTCCSRKRLARRPSRRNRHAATSSARPAPFLACQCVQQLSARPCAQASRLHSAAIKTQTRSPNAYERVSHTIEAWSPICKKLCASAVVRLPRAALCTQLQHVCTNQACWGFIAQHFQDVAAQYELSSPSSTTLSPSSSPDTSPTASHSTWNSPGSLEVEGEDCSCGFGFCKGVWHGDQAWKTCSLMPTCGNTSPTSTGWRCKKPRLSLPWSTCT
ncbi:hypothetical protein BU25DRAFT_417425 [Macroventuria anomochaeta]|uniref:Uncharacterized protein n=1 Tax=Macroventuria anomochaeta TaxID=301207 RepID=A0ACB6SFA3_9PLEO|nr:uncharacterized protein BU25DRAFT_417425 [Macroventuria anomochaeta]KAF2632846.1 hypothetical protein BU25DRAFT_417425 [Macroventuria anomochaeta]